MSYLYQIQTPFDNTAEWLKEVRKYTTGDIRICLIGNKNDLQASKEITTQAGQVSILIRNMNVETSK